MIETRSRAWIWIVVAGIAVAVIIATLVARAVLRALPENVRDPVNAAVKQHAPPLGIGLLLMITAVVFGLWSAGLPVIENAEGTTTNLETAAEDDNATTGDTVASTTDATTSAGAPVGQARGTATTARRAAAGGVSVGAPTNLNIREPNLFSGANNTRGITNDTIKICGHAALSLGAVLNTRPEDLLVFWRYLNDKGGIYGRKFDVSLEDDQYTAEGGVPAAQACAERNPFMIFGALGSDVLPPVRLWAEQNKELYLYGFTVKKGSENLRYSYSAVISLEDLSLVMADMIVRKFPGKKVGLLWRNSSNIQPGRDAFKKHLESKGSDIVADLPVQKGQGAYSNEIITLQQRGAEAVAILDDAVSQLNIIKQGKTQQYHPNWVVFTFNIQTQTLKADALNPPLVGANLAPAYECRTHDGPYASYANEIREFEAAYRKYSPNTDLCGFAGDIAWAGWIGFKGMAALFEACGPNCTRNRWAGVMESGYKASIGAGCELDFSKSGHHGGFRADLMEAYRGGAQNRESLRNTERCVKAPGA